jgi:hypothetical protein
MGKRKYIWLILALSLAACDKEEQCCYVVQSKYVLLDEIAGIQYMVEYSDCDYGLVVASMTIEDYNEAQKDCCL